MLEVGPVDREPVDEVLTLVAGRKGLREGAFHASDVGSEPLEAVGHRHRVVPVTGGGSGRGGRRGRAGGALLVFDAGVHVRADLAGVPLGPGLGVVTEQDRLPERDPVGDLAGGRVPVVGLSLRLSRGCGLMT